ncbi:MAG: BMC domain-containing protein [Synergistetes bacterium]|nr:MAG: Microcompartments protein [bacterium 42_11]MBC7332668.1 BMC domain-containing protein [Synergistota bacterium]MDK2870672.1 ethanolamine utilization protein EutM [bacterium]
MKNNKGALGFIETVGLVAAITAADAACKAANVELVGRENPKGGIMTIKIKGEVSAVKAALAAACAAASKVNKVVSMAIIPRPDESMCPILVYNKETMLVTEVASILEETKAEIVAGSPLEEKLQTELSKVEEDKTIVEPEENESKEEKVSDDIMKGEEETGEAYKEDKKKQMKKPRRGRKKK